MLYMYHGILESISELKLLKTGRNVGNTVTVDQLICQYLYAPVLS